MEKEWRLTQKVPEVDDFVRKIREARKEVEEVLKKTNEVMKRKAGRSRGEAASAELET